MIQKHTPGPWEVIDSAILQDPTIPERIWIQTAGDLGVTPVIARIANEVSKRPLTEEDRANAAFIVRACNSFDAMFSVLAQCADVFSRIPDDAFGFVEDTEGDENGPYRWSIAREIESEIGKALALAKGE